MPRVLFQQGARRGVAPLRPPWALPEAEFIEECDGCAKCITSCETQVLKSARGRYPVVDFTNAECTFCRACLDACPGPALSDAEHVWSLKASASELCLSSQGVMCRACGEACEVRAIGYKLIVGGFSRPEIDLDTCTGCGACVAQCPVGAIEIKHLSYEGECVQ